MYIVTSDNVTWFHLNHYMVLRRIYKLSFYEGHPITSPCRASLVSWLLLFSWWLGMLASMIEAWYSMFLGLKRSFKRLTAMGVALNNSDYKC